MYPTKQKDHRLSKRHRAAPRSRPEPLIILKQNSQALTSQRVLGRRLASPVLLRVVKGGPRTSSLQDRPHTGCESTSFIAETLTASASWCLRRGSNPQHPHHASASRVFVGPKIDARSEPAAVSPVRRVYLWRNAAGSVRARHGLSGARSSEDLAGRGLGRSFGVTRRAPGAWRGVGSQEGVLDGGGDEGGVAA